MKIFWVEDFDVLKNTLDAKKIISETKYFLEPLLSKDQWSHEKTDVFTEGDFEVLDYIAKLTKNTNPILWAGDLPSALACIEFGAAAYLNENKYRKIEQISFPFDFAIIDFYIPTSPDTRHFAKLTKEADEFAKKQYEYLKYELNKDDFINSPLKEFLQEKQVNCAGVLVALKLIEKGFPLSRIKFLTGNAKDLSRFDLSYGILGNDLKDNVVNKTPEEIDLLRYNIIHDEYYNSRNLIIKTTDVLLKQKSKDSDILELTKERHPDSKIYDFDDIKEKLELVKDLFTPLFPEEVIIKENKSACFSYNAQKYNAFRLIILLDFSRNYYDEKKRSSPDPRIKWSEKKYDLLRLIRNTSYHSALLASLDAKSFSIIYAIYVSLLCDIHSLDESVVAKFFYENFSVIFGKELSENNVTLDDDFFDLEGKILNIKDKCKNVLGDSISFYELFKDLKLLEKLEFKKPIDLINLLFWSRFIGDYNLNKRDISAFTSSKLTKLLFYIFSSETMKNM